MPITTAAMSFRTYETYSPDVRDHYHPRFPSSKGGVPLLVSNRPVRIDWSETRREGEPEERKPTFPIVPTFPSVPLASRIRLGPPPPPQPVPSFRTKPSTWKRAPCAFSSGRCAYVARTKSAWPGLACNYLHADLGERWYNVNDQIVLLDEASRTHLAVRTRDGLACLLV